MTARLESESNALDSARADLLQERASWESRLQAADAEISHANSALELADRARHALDTQLNDNQALRADLVQQRDRIQAAYESQAIKVMSFQTQLVESANDLRDSREQQDTYLRNVEDRAHQEVDLARQDAKQWQRRFEASERTHQTVLTSLHAERDLLREQLRKADHDVGRYIGVVAGLEKALQKVRVTAPRRSKANAPKKNAPAKAGRLRKKAVPGKL